MENILVDQSALIQEYIHIRSKTLELCRSLETEDYNTQCMEDVSPPKWHLAHTTWFFETFLLETQKENYVIYDNAFRDLFNSYYQIGSIPVRKNRGHLSRPTIESVLEYRIYVDNAMLKLLNQEESKKIYSILMLGLQHEQQHQELLLMDIKYNYSLQYNFPIYNIVPTINEKLSIPFIWLEIECCTAKIGFRDGHFCYDNELPEHSYLLEPYFIGNRLVTNREFYHFILAGGYENPDFWLHDGWNYIKQFNIKAPLYWQEINNEWFIFTLNGLQPINLDEPVIHVSYYEADAYAKFSGARLPTEFEWEYYVKKKGFLPKEKNFLEGKFFHPTPGNMQFLGDAWEWTSSAYLPYPGFKPLVGHLGEYNGKFMSNQMVLRGGSCLTPLSHIRSTYRNFYSPDKRWALSGIRLAKSM